MNQEKNIETPLGKLIPFFEISDGRQKNRPSVEYFKTGELYSIYLQEQTLVKTPVGMMPAELITFYKSGAIKRIFPLYGQISGFWTEEDEYRLATEISIPVLDRVIKVKPLCIYFYESGVIRSITIWNKERISVDTQYGSVTTDLGIELYETGSLKSIEPVLGTKLIIPPSQRDKVESRIISSDGKINWNDGEIYPYYAMAFRMHADDNSLKFNIDGSIREVRTVPLYRKRA